MQLTFLNIIYLKTPSPPPFIFHTTVSSSSPPPGFRLLRSKSILQDWDGFDGRNRNHGSILQIITKLNTLSAELASLLNSPGSDILGLTRSIEIPELVKPEPSSRVEIKEENERVSGADTNDNLKLSGPGEPSFESNRATSSNLRF